MTFITYRAGPATAALMALSLAALSVQPSAHTRAAELQLHSSPDRVVGTAVGMPAERVRTDAQAQDRWVRQRSTRRSGAYPRPGYSVRQGQRMAAKRRNQVRARRAARG